MMKKAIKVFQARSPGILEERVNAFLKERCGLGFDPYEYEAWVREGDETVTEIVNAHRNGRTLREVRIAQVMLEGLFSLRGL